MADDAIFCATIKPPLLDKCMTMAEWSATWQSLGILITLSVAIGALIKYFMDKSVARKQAEKSHKLERVKFFLDQHRRLFDDPDLKIVLQYLDGDDPRLAEEECWEKNRKFAVFIEEVELLIRSEMLNSDACQYMFGYYANCAFKGKNFRQGMNFDEDHWTLFSEFARNYEQFSKTSGSSSDWNFTL
ncbi:hypothetical protein OIN59_11540 [Acidovorax sp. D2M1]|uniref:Phage abortive infection protein n=1 Tax=Acidovorax benzenivorans TaxID=2987520 RepID=A0ABT5RWJ1_9BURK|nr:hypothetical protein [Acidovorax benzenivorans]MDD2178067.1 hypothetical protein [Acidovorax benzenivorans]